MPRHEGLEPSDPVLQVVGFHMRVPHRGGQVGVSKELLNDARIDACPEESRCDIVSAIGERGNWRFRPWNGPIGGGT